MGSPWKEDATFLAVAGERCDKKDRADKTPFELFVAGLAGWDSLMRKRLDDGKSKVE